MSLPPGHRFGPYEILGPLGAGGMGEVYRAKDTRLGRDVAIKLIPTHLSQNPEVRERFEREARAISSMNHPHICTLYDIGREGDADYFVMELLDGESLAARLTRGPLKLDDALRLGAQIADGLSAAHKQGIVHRDLKPGNVMLTKSGDMYWTVPTMAPCEVSGVVRVAMSTMASSRNLATPKSRTLAPVFVRAMFPGFRSRWTIPCLCAAANASAICAPNFNTSSCLSGPRSSRAESDSPSRSSMTK